MRGAALHTLTQLLGRPHAFFDKRDPVSTLPIAVSLVVLLAIALGISTVLLGSMLAGSIDATVTVDNPDRPPEWVCDRYGNDSDSHLGTGCDEPETVERDVGPIVYDMMTDYLAFAVVAPFMLWFLGGIVLFVSARLVNGTPSIGGAFALAGWAALPEFVRLGVGLVAIRFALSDVTITDPERADVLVQAAFATIDPLLTIATVLTVGWQWYLLTGGMIHDADLERWSAALAVGVPLAIWLLVALF